MGALRALRVTGRVVWLLAGTLWLILGLLWRTARQPARRLHWQSHYRRAWGRLCCRALSIHITQTGTAPSEPCLIVGNHHSWVDPPALMATAGCTLLSKADVQHLPIVGWGARLVGILFVDRGAVRSRAQAQQALAAVLRQGIQAALFPEGTTAPAGQLLPLQPGSFKLVGSLGLPVALCYLHYPNPAHVWGEEPMARHVMRTVGRGATHLHLTWGPLLPPAPGEALRQQAEAWLQGQVVRGSGSAPASRGV